MANHTGYTDKQLMTFFMDAYIDGDHIVRWRSNDQIPFQDMLADFRSMGWIDEDAQLGILIYQPQCSEVSQHILERYLVVASPSHDVVMVDVGTHELLH